ncbi:NAD(P)-dependent oxidoreductase [Caldimonas thermodepolymerans]|jgi:Putative NADH-flavin reductase|uniref:NAD(P)-dependent oxidoreductase n=1 Tax=Caldimonas thermodepolymerans TaxID=215580 RepID=UPI0024904F07|nr:NAD(P)-dependent oxidoreductase [Caldimonas thermodepolymerans]
MKLALIGPTGFVGSAVLDEALQRDHQVTALARTPGKLAARDGLTVVQADVLDPAQVAAAVAGHDAVISAYNPGWSDPQLYDTFLRGTRAIFEGVKRAGVKRLLVVGGAGSLYVKPGVQLVDTPEFPEAWKQGALATREALNLIRQETGLDWTFVSPAARLEPGERTGKYRLGADELLMDGDQPARISVADLAVSILDEVERPQHIRKRYTAAY